MRSILLITALTVLTTGATELNRITPNDPNNPIIAVDWSHGDNDLERIHHIEAFIMRRHVRARNRVSFPSSGPIDIWYRAIRQDEDERGHLVAAVFSGPPYWYNLTPQHARVNRNLGSQSITTDWYGAECEALEFLRGGDNRAISWIVDLSYHGGAARPYQYHLRVLFSENSRCLPRSIDAYIENPVAGTSSSTFSHCRECRRNRGHGVGCSRG